QSCQKLAVIHSRPNKNELIERYHGTGRSGDQARSFSNARGRFARYTCALRCHFRKDFCVCASEKRGGDTSNSPIFALSVVAMFSKVEVPSRRLSSAPAR